MVTNDTVVTLKNPNKGENNSAPLTWNTKREKTTLVPKKREHISQNKIKSTNKKA